MLCAILASFVLQIGGYRAEYPLPGPNLNGFGVDIHFVEPPAGEIEKIADEGFKWVRMDFYWAVVEKHPPQFNFRPYDELMDELDRNHIRPIFILDSIQPSYGQTQSDPNVRQAFCRFVQASIEHFKHRGIVWEMWNEPNLDDYWKPHANADEYAELAKDVGQTIRRTSPDEWYVGPALSHTDWPFLEQIFRDGVLDYFDAVTMHPYRPDPPETVEDDWVRLGNLIRRYQPEDKRVAMISGEWGYSGLAIGDQTQAQYAARMLLMNLMCGVDMSMWYDWKDDEGSPEPRQRHFGMVHGDGSDKLVSSYLAQLRAALQGFHYVSRVPTLAGSYVLVFEKGNLKKLVAWTTDPAGDQIRLGQVYTKGQTLGQSTEKSLIDHRAQITPTPTIFE